MVSPRFYFQKDFILLAMLDVSFNTIGMLLFRFLCAVTFLGFFAMLSSFTSYYISLLRLLSYVRVLYDIYMLHLLHEMDTLDIPLSLPF